MQKQAPRNGPCPCGSGRKYKHCCLRKDIEWCHSEDGVLSRQVALDPDTADALEAHIREQEQVRGAPLDDDDLLFPEMAQVGEAELLEHLAEAMQEAKIDPAVIYAFRQTGRLVTEENMQLIPEADLQECQQAIEEFQRMQN